MTRVLTISDLHSMHRAGLVHPDFDARPQDRESPHFKLYRLRTKMFKFYQEVLDFLKPIDVLIVNGDATEGKGKKSGGTELLTADRSEQASNAACLINMAGARVVEMTYGTPYHVGASEDWENEVAKEVENLDRIESVGYYQIEDLVFQARHYAGRSSVPYGRFTPLAKEQIWNVLWKERGEYPRVDVILRCLSEDTEILTPRGWMSHGKIQEDDQALTLNRERNRLEWNPILAKTSNHDYSEMIHVTAKGYDVLVTPDHTMIYRPTSSDHYLSKTASRLASMNTFRLPVSGHLDSPGVDIPDEMLKLLAWVIAEGNMDAGNRSKGYPEKNNVRIFQSESNATVVEKVIQDANVPYTRNVRSDKGQKIQDGDKVYQTKENTVVFYLRQPHSRQIISMLDGTKNIPDWLMQMNSRQFRIFLEEYIKGDGSRAPETEKFQGKLFTANQDLADRLQILLVCNGFKSQVSTRKKWGKESYVVYFVEKQDVHIRAVHSFRFVPYSGLTWCVSVPNGTLVTRHNGKVAIVGNSHVHYFAHCGESDWAAFTTPALQAYWTKFGTRICTGTVDFGLLWFDVEGSSMSWDKKLLRLCRPGEAISNVNKLLTVSQRSKTASRK